MATPTDAILRDLGLRIRELRRAAGMTQEQAADQLGMWTPNYAKIEGGKVNLTVNSLVKLAMFFHVEVGELFMKPTDRNVRAGRPPKKGV